jgi:hypothetical protein
MEVNMKRLLLIALLFAAVLALPIQADFIQCPSPPAGNCTGSDNPDLINGSALPEVFIEGLLGNDIIFGNDGDDEIRGNEGDDVLFGGPGSDELRGGDNNDIMFPGPDDFSNFQFVTGLDNDQTIVLAGDTANCLRIEDGGGFDVAILIGFGPYSIDKPFGGLPPGFDGYISLIDPIAGGNIFIEVLEADDTGIERINGLMNPNVALILPEDLPENCAD